MSLANLITIGRIAVIPVFVLAIMYYAAGVKHGHPEEWLRWAAAIIFIGAAATDALDGYVARRMQQKTRIGSILDPLADKALLLVTLLLLSWNHGNAFDQLPLWFPIVVISRDVILVLGVAVIFMINRNFDIRPHGIGKAATVLQMITLGMVLLKAPYSSWIALLWLAGISTVVSGGIYVVRDVKKFGT